MLKIVLRTLIILLVTGLVAGGIYLFVENSGASWLGVGSMPGGRLSGTEIGQGFPEGAMPERTSDGKMLRGGHSREGEMGFSLAGLSGVVMQVGKIAVITILVLAVQAVVRLFKRRRPVSTVPA